MSALLDYIRAWQDEDINGILQTLDPECVVIESYGPTYRGKPRVEQWARMWFGQGGRIHAWDVLSHRVGDRFEVAEWRFDCTWEGKRGSFDGCTVATVQNGVIETLREYMTSAPLYNWTGHWKV